MKKLIDTNPSHAKNAEKSHGLSGGRFLTISPVNKLLRLPRLPGDSSHSRRPERRRRKRYEASPRRPTLPPTRFATIRVPAATLTAPVTGADESTLPPAYEAAANDSRGEQLHLAARQQSNFSQRAADRYLAAGGWHILRNGSR